MGGGGDHGHVPTGGDFRGKVWSMTGGPYCRPKHWRRNTAIAMFGIFLVCIPIAMKSAELESLPELLLAVERLADMPKLASGLISCRRSLRVPSRMRLTLGFSDINSKDIEMTSVTYSPLIVASHARNGYLTTPLVFGDFPPVVGSPFFLGVVPAAKEVPETPASSAAGGIKPRLFQGRVFSAHVVSHTTTAAKEGSSHAYKGKKPTAATSRSGRTVIVGNLRIRLDEDELVMPKDKIILTIPTLNRFAPLRQK
ncbi:hypothetical protein Taro_038598 [Colocasia esculenta]|uniref:Uncharacterized protein n=1 Tax=Colocasia esculenta TaxID=4460 RepID=A0A843WP47_COLES|nr:hypothetical protein [Colocasia esculenta]